jgi:hypothetical protein
LVGGGGLAGFIGGGFAAVAASLNRLFGRRKE